MRSEKEMFDLILGVAEKDERIRAVYLNGSRTNPNVPKDIFQDYDIVYVVKETGSFIENETWIHVFGELIMIQEPDKNDTHIGMEIDSNQSYGYLMLLNDGNRIDLRIRTIENAVNEITTDKLAMILLDKDSCLPIIPPATDIDYHVKKPTDALFFGCCNDFWWCNQNVVKGIWRDELPYAKQMFELVIRGRLDEMVSWWIGLKHDFQISTGKMGKYFNKYLPETYWKMYKETYSNSNYEDFWHSIFIACDLFRTLAKEVAGQLGFTYPMQDDENMTKYMKHVKELPADAKEIFL